MPWKKRFNKYNAKPTNCNQDHRHASASESSRCDYLHLLKRAGEIIHVDVQPRVSLTIGSYRPDFLVWRKSKPDGALLSQFEEVKGFVTRDFTLIRRAFDNEHPAAPLIVVKRKGKGWQQI